ncbi:hypothetical protein HQQ82_18775 [Rathayibacter sp. VKM Ac-2856]|uniref:hypothetical protein n=1 Tax=unclassified Rathayibacter TaxID=2609250 RepID=UPI0015673929|nr:MULTISPECIES: hypothetical protein [unclassified Rathayibacter]NQX06849.1 hypothetical protein [Rathayibacter sp. VKM Ac-2858]NQX22016.1 hypothetical protein [Rathayibacter sp. VKM Ac-2856]
MTAAAIATATLTSPATRHPFDGPISREHYQSDRLARRLELIEATIAECERDLRGFLDPRTGAVVPPARGSLRDQLLSNLAIEHALADRLRGALGLHL